MFWDKLQELTQPKTVDNNKLPFKWAKVLGEGCNFNTLSGYCKSNELVNITFHPDVRTIRFASFCDCPNLERVYIPRTVEVIEGNCFMNNPKLHTVIFEAPSNLKSIGSSDFQETPWIEGLDDFAMVGDILLKYKGDGDTVYIPEKVRVISHGAFKEKNMKHVIFSKESICSYIGFGAFAGCVNLEEIRMPGSMRIIEDVAFSGCRSLNRLELNDDIERVHFKAFKECVALEDAIYPHHLDEDKDGCPPFLKYETKIYEEWRLNREREKAVEWYLELLENKAFLRIYEYVKQEALDKDELNTDSGIDDVFDYIWTHAASRTMSPESLNLSGDLTFTYWECPKDYFCCGFASAIIAEGSRLRHYHKGVAFEIGQDDELKEEDAATLKKLSEAYDFQICVFRRLISGGYTDILTGDKYALSSTYAGYSHDGSEDYYDITLYKCGE